jgi:inhibitor of KinA
MLPSFQIFPLGDSAINITYGNTINDELNNEVISRFHQFNNYNLPWIKDLVPAYSSLTIHYDLLQLQKKFAKEQTVYDWVKNFVEEKLKEEANFKVEESELIKIPVSYHEEDGPDIESICKENNLTRDELIRIHTNTVYKVYMIGFLPGFPYMGEVDERIASPRKKSPVNVKAGSVGIAGRQTGIYPLDSPGGWKIIGRTDLKLFDVTKDPPVLLKPGDRVEFYEVNHIGL